MRNKKQNKSIFILIVTVAAILAVIAGIVLLVHFIKEDDGKDIEPHMRALPKPEGTSVSAEVKMENGLPKLYINGQENPPLILFVNVGSAEYNETLDEVKGELRLAAERGINLVSVDIHPAWMLDYEGYNMTDTERIIDTVIETHPDAFIILRVGLGLEGAHRWLERNPEDLVVYADGTTGGASGSTVYVSCASDLWAEKATALLAQMIAHFNADEKYAKRIVAYHPSALNTGEWFQWVCREKGADLSVTNTKKFRAWLRETYQNDILSLRAAWCDETVTFETAEIAVPPGNAGKAEEYTILNKPEDQRHLDYYTYTQWLVSSRVSLFSKTVKEHTDNKALVVQFYGYTMEVVTPNSGHLAMETILQDPNIDILVSPIGYHDRNDGGYGAFMAPVDAVHAAGKLWVVEDDIRTKPSTTEPDHTYNPVVENLTLVEAVHKREIGAIMIRGAGTWYMDLWGAGWLNSVQLMDNIAALNTLYRSYTATLRVKDGDVSAYRPQVAVILDEDSIYRYAMPQATGWDTLYHAVRTELYRAGVTFGYYTTADMTNGRVPSSVKLFIFPNPLHIDDAEMAGIRQYQKEGNTFWYFTGFGDNTEERITELTGMQIVLRNKESTWVRLLSDAEPHVLTDGLAESGISRVAHSFFASPTFTVVGGGTVLGRSGSLNTFAFAENEGWKAVYTGCTRPIVELYRTVARYAGVQVFDDAGDTVFGNDELLVIHTKHGGDAERTVCFPGVVDVYDYFAQVWHRQVSSITVPVEDASTYYFFYGEYSKLLAKKIVGIHPAQ